MCGFQKWNYWKFRYFLQDPGSFMNSEVNSSLLLLLKRVIHVLLRGNLLNNEWMIHQTTLFLPHESVIPNIVFILGETLLKIPSANHELLSSSSSKWALYIAKLKCVLSSKQFLFHFKFQVSSAQGSNSIIISYVCVLNIQAQVLTKHHLEVSLYYSKYYTSASHTYVQLFSPFRQKWVIFNFSW